MNPQQTTPEKLFPIRTVAELTGVNPVTLRAWERRHGLLTPVRTDSGHRLYTPEHIDLVNRVVGLLDRGMRIGQVKAHLDSLAVAGTDQATEHERNWRRYINRMIAAVIQFDEEQLEETYGEAMASHPVKSVTERLLVPLLTELGSRWESGDGTVAEEHFFSCYLRSKLGARFHHRVRSLQGPKLLLACLPGDRHETGLLLFGLAANEAGFRVVMLGADMPLEGIPDAALKMHADAVVLSGLVLPSRDLLQRRLRVLVDEVNVPVLVGGQASVQAHAALKKQGVAPLGADIARSVQTLRQQLLH